MNALSKKKIFEKSMWSFLDVFSSGILQFVFFIIIARILSPEDFGVFAIVNIFFLLGNIVINSLVGAAVIQRKNIDEEYEKSAFLVSLLTSSVLFLIYNAIASFVSSFYNNQEIEYFVKAISFSVFFVALGIVPYSLLRKRLQFKPIAISSAVAVTLAMVISLYLANRGFGVWALVAYVLSHTFLKSLLVVIYSRWLPSCRGNRKDCVELIGYGKYLMGAGIIDCIYRNTYSLVIGKLFLFVDLGYYNQAQRITDTLSNNMNKSVVNFIFPYFSSIEIDDLSKIDKYRNVLVYYTFLTFFIIGFVFTFSSEIVLTVLTEKWAPMIGFLELFMAVAIMFPLHTVNLNIIKVSGRSDLFFRLEIIKKSLGAVILFVTCFFSIKMIIAGRIFQSFLGLFINTRQSYFILKYSLKEQLFDIRYNLAGLVSSVLLTRLFKSYLHEGFLVSVLLYVTIFFSIAFLKNIEYFRKIYT